MIKATINFCLKNTKYDDLKIGKKLFFRSTEHTDHGDETHDVYGLDLNFYYNDQNSMDQINKDMNTVYHEFTNNIHMVKEMLGYHLYRIGVISNGYDIRCISTLGDILNRYTISVDMNHTLFIINGSGSHGKDTFIEFVRRNCTHTLSFSTIEPIRDNLPQLGINVSNKTEADRLLLSSIKAAIMKYDPEWSRKQVYNLEKEIKNNLYATDPIIFIHCREKEDIDRIKSLGAYTLLIRNKNVPHIISNESDKNVFDYDYDFIIDNNDDLTVFAEKASNFSRTMTHFCYN